MYDIESIKKALPHRYPFLLIDRVLEMEPHQSIVAIKNVTVNEPFFQGHFPGQAVMPGVLIIEAMAQAGGFMMLESNGIQGTICYLTGVDKAKFRRPVVPGDQLVLTVTLDRVVRRMGRVTAKATVDGQLAAEAVLSFVLSEEGKGQ